MQELQRRWRPSLDEEHAALADVLRSMPRNPATDVPFVVRLLENPVSPVALPGAVNLFGHDCIHALLGRGLLPQDEAFVLGFTMGTARNLRPWHVDLFLLCAEQLYRDPYRFTALDAQVFAFAVSAGQASGAVPLAQVDFRSHFHRGVGSLRREVGIDPALLRGLYAVEASRWPGTDASLRLPVARLPSELPCARRAPRSDSPPSRVRGTSADTHALRGPSGVDYGGSSRCCSSREG